MSEPKPKRPRQEHPFLVGCTEQEAGLIARGAKALGMGPVSYLRESALAAARDGLGIADGRWR